MSALDLFNRVLGKKTAQRGQADTTLPAASVAPGEFAGLNFMTAIDAHMKWKTRLENYIQGTSDEDLNVEVVCRDDQCPLGKWICSTGGERFGMIDTFTEMKTHHTIFHQCAGKVLTALQSGNKEEALHLLHHGDYVRTSEQVKRLLAKLHVRLNTGA